MAEPTIDATVDLLSSESRFGKFRSAKTPVHAAVPGIGLEDLLTEVARRQRILHQLAPVVTADTVVARNPFLSTPDIGVLAPQWALLVRVRDGSTPRALAWELGRSVFGTTLEVYRLLALRLLSSADHRAHRNGQEPRYGPATMSFVRAVSPEEGGIVAAGVPRRSRRVQHPREWRMMPERRQSPMPVEDRVRQELQRIRERVVGVHGSLTATSDGLLIAHDLSDREPTQIAALIATTLALGSRMTLSTGRGQFRETVTRGTDGYLAVYAAWPQFHRGRHRYAPAQRRHAAVPNSRDHRAHRHVFDRVRHLGGPRHRAREFDRDVRVRRPAGAAPPMDTPPTLPARRRPLG